MVSTHTKEIHEEVHSYKCLDCCIVDMAYCATLNKAGAVTVWCQSSLQVAATVPIHHLTASVSIASDSGTDRNCKAGMQNTYKITP